MSGLEQKSFEDDPMQSAATEAAAFLKSLSNPGRLRLLCAMAPGPMSVGELERVLGASQSYVSGQLLRLRAEGLVCADRDGRTVLYRLSDHRVRPVLERLYDVFCPKGDVRLSAQEDTDDNHHQTENR